MSGRRIPFFFETVGLATFRFANDCITLLTFIGVLASAVFKALCHPTRIRWKETFYYMDICGTNALPIASLICFSMGLILGFQGAVQLQKYGGDIFLADGVGVAITIELGPLMVAMIAIGQAGSAFAAEIGTMKVSEEIDAMETMGLEPSRFLIVPKLLAMVIVMPLLTIYGDIMGILGGMVVGVVKLGLPISTYLHRTTIAILPNYVLQGLIKSVVFAVIITAIGCMRGFEASKDAQGVGRSATSAVVSGIFLVILADTLLTILFSVIF